MELDLNQKIKRNAVPFGLTLGVISTVLGILSFYVLLALREQMLLMITIPFIFGILIPLILLIIFVSKLRAKIGGFWNYRQAVTGIFIMVIISFGIQYLLKDILFATIIEPQMVEKTQIAMTAAVTATLEKSGAKQEEIDKKIDDMQKNFELQKENTIGKRIQSIVISIILLFAVSLIFAAFFKKEGHSYDPGLDPTV
ncbi:DUF4199 domain-containing protein [Mucilaginibacter sp. 21P]|uniref:DUF4199 domain-containing protein n=1 Tax=Mucilaginibacter sp. 21P TaxID=2778902 RepID=UPI001C55A4BB|nr:DUF4199 domain-containing protein [Mucilaginibacter sp. 21P]QXV63937.1 DUF4199 domain-containing protein [Mucilaginibacter sp. 21P]